jgi:hypothetical protein
MSKKFHQRLFWSVARPIKYLGLSFPEEWGVVSGGVFPGIFLVNDGQIRLGLGFIIGGIVGCYLLKRYKRAAEGFKMKSFLMAKGLAKTPGKYPKMLNKKKVGR